MCHKILSKESCFTSCREWISPKWVAVSLTIGLIVFGIGGGTGIFFYLSPLLTPQFSMIGTIGSSVIMIIGGCTAAGSLIAFCCRFGIGKKSISEQYDEEDKQKIIYDIDNLYKAAQDLNETAAYQIIKEGKVDINDTTHYPNGRAPLHRAVLDTLFPLNTIDILLKMGANPNIQDSDGNTPLHLAAMHCNRHVVFALCDNQRVNKQIKNNDGKLPIDLIPDTSDQDPDDVIPTDSSIIRIALTQ